MAAEFPMVSVSGSNPYPSYFEEEAEEFVVGKTIYDDNGADYKLQNGGAGVKRWIIKYTTQLAAKAALLDAHVATTFYSEEQGSAVGFNFRSHIVGDTWTSTAGTLHANVHYAPGGYKKSHKGLSCVREVILEKRP